MQAARVLIRCLGSDVVTKFGGFRGGAMMTEGMSCDSTNLTTEAECIAVQELLDENLFSWTDYGESQGALFQPNRVQQAVWGRTYARAVAGIPLNMSFDIT